MRPGQVLIMGKGNAAFETAWHLMPAAGNAALCSRTTLLFAGCAAMVTSAESA